MSRVSLLSLLTALAIAAGIPPTGANAADYDGRYHPVPRHAERYDDDGAATPRYRGSRHGGWGGQHYIRRVEARASYASDYLPGSVKEWRARRSAIDAWKSKVANIYGESYAHWRMATEKQVDCDGAAGSVYCTVSARPARGWSGWGGYGRYRESRND